MKKIICLIICVALVCVFPYAVFAESPVIKGLDTVNSNALIREIIDFHVINKGLVFLGRSKKFLCALFAETETAGNRALMSLLV